MADVLQLKLDLQISQQFQKVLILESNLSFTSKYIQSNYLNNPQAH